MIVSCRWRETKGKVGDSANLDVVDEADVVVEDGGGEEGGACEVDVIEAELVPLIRRRGAEAKARRAFLQGCCAHEPVQQSADEDSHFQ